MAARLWSALHGSRNAPRRLRTRPQVVGARRNGCGALHSSFKTAYRDIGALHDGIEAIRRG